MQQIGFFPGDFAPNRSLRWRSHRFHLRDLIAGKVHGIRMLCGRHLHRESRSSFVRSDDHAFLSCMRPHAHAHLIAYSAAVPLVDVPSPKEKPDQRCQHCRREDPVSQGKIQDSRHDVSQEQHLNESRRGKARSLPMLWQERRQLVHDADHLKKNGENKPALGLPASTNHSITQIATGLPVLAEA